MNIFLFSPSITCNSEKKFFCLKPRPLESKKLRYMYIEIFFLNILWLLKLSWKHDSITVLEETKCRENFRDTCKEYKY